mgnify:FL=1
MKAEDAFALGPDTGVKATGADNIMDASPNKVMGTDAGLMVAPPAGQMLAMPPSQPADQMMPPINPSVELPGPQRGGTVHIEELPMPMPSRGGDSGDIPDPDGNE